jgi:hypothetical protein
VRSVLRGAARLDKTTSYEQVLKRGRAWVASRGRGVAVAAGARPGACAVRRKPDRRQHALGGQADLAVVAGHSLTLLVATLAGWKLNATVVDVVIALSLVYVAVQWIRGRPESLRVMGVPVFAFGLVHGLGLSTRLQALGLPDDGLVTPPPSVAALADELRLAQHPQVLGDRRPADLEMRGDLAGLSSSSATRRRISRRLGSAIAVSAASIDVT